MLLLVHHKWVFHKGSWTKPKHLIFLQGKRWLTLVSTHRRLTHNHQPQSYRNSYIGLPRHWQWPKHRVFFKPLVPDKAGGVGDPGTLWLSLLTHSASPRVTQTCWTNFKMLRILQTFKMPSIPHMSSCTRHHESCSDQTSSHPKPHQRW